MALEEFEDKPEDRRNRFAKAHSLRHYGMGFLLFLMGLFFLFPATFSERYAYLSGDAFMKIVGGLCIIYGLFRIYRGYKG